MRPGVSSNLSFVSMATGAGEQKKRGGQNQQMAATTPPHPDPLTLHCSMHVLAE